VVSVQRGLDPRGLALLAFGGAGPLHAAALARELGMRRILCPRASGVLCALGLAAAAPRRDAARTVMLAGKSLSAERLAEERTALLRRACEDLREEPARVAVRYELRYRGQSFELSVSEDDGGAKKNQRGAENNTSAEDSGGTGNRAGAPSPRTLRESFARAHEQRYGYRDERSEVELVTIRASAWGAAPAIAPTGAVSPPATVSPPAAVSPLPSASPAPATFAPPPGSATGASGPPRVPWAIVLDGVEVQAERLDGELPPGTRVAGPALCALPESTLLVPPGWSGEVDAFGTIQLVWAEGSR
jgi:N-methylhydantoinase A/oxoprolinase/acetone carboxylase beta subunit